MVYAALMRSEKGRYVLEQFIGMQLRQYALFVI